MTWFTGRAAGGRPSALTRPGVSLRVFGVAGPLALLLATGHGAPAPSWQIQPTPALPGATAANLKGVSCTSPVACVAVGYTAGADGTSVTLAEAWHKGTWTAQATPNPATSASAELDGVSCTAANACTAVGHYFDATTSIDMTLAERWNGFRWQIEATPSSPAGIYGSDLRSVSCSSARSCAAVGIAFTDTGEVGFAETWNGVAWRAESASPANTSFSDLGGVSCTVVGCVAVGSYADADGNSVPLAELWNGFRWLPETLPSPADGAGPDLSGVSCTSAGACTAVGSYFSTSTGAAQTLAEHWDGIRWRIQATPGISGGAQEAGLAGVSCAGRNACTAVGFYETSDFTPTQALAEAWDGSTWTIQATPAPSDAVGGFLNGASCTAAACTAVGYYDSSSGPQLTLALGRSR